MSNVIVDCRNEYESELGRFENALPLNTAKFSESWNKIDKILETVPKSTKVYTYCTGFRSPTIHTHTHHTATLVRCSLILVNFRRDSMCQGECIY